LIKLRINGNVKDDCHTYFSVSMDKKYTIGEFIEEILKTNPEESGSFYVLHKGYRILNLHYSDGKLIGTIFGSTVVTCLLRVIENKRKELFSDISIITDHRGLIINKTRDVLLFDLVYDVHITRVVANGGCKKMEYAIIPDDLELKEKLNSIYGNPEWVENI
jgi:hypothetical protein